MSRLSHIQKFTDEKQENNDDHLDRKTVIALKERVKKVVCPLGIGENFEYWGYSTLITCCIGEIVEL